MRRIAVLAALAALLLAASTAQAQGTVFGAEVHGSFNTYAMKHVNDELDAFNATDATANFDNITNGFTGGINLRLWANTNWLFTAGWEPLFGNSESAVADADELGNPGNIKIDTNAQSLQIGASYFFPSESTGKFGIGAGLGWYLANGEREMSPTGLAASTEEVKGSGVGFHFLGQGEWAVSPGFAVTGAAGYRIAKVEKLEVDGIEDPDLDIDYSGFMGRVGLSFYLPSGGGDY